MRQAREREKEKKKRAFERSHAHVKTHKCKSGREERRWAGEGIEVVHEERYTAHLRMQAAHMRHSFYVSGE